MPFFILVFKNLNLMKLDNSDDIISDALIFFSVVSSSSLIFRAIASIKVMNLAYVVM